MLPLAHRGHWHTRAEQNSAAAFRRSFDGGFGLETDLRDLDGRLVVSHDPPRAGAMPVEALLELHARHGAGTALALNVKADGLQPLVAAALGSAGPGAHFVFDMAVPDMRGYLAQGTPTFTRHSDAEPEPAYYGRAAGVWLDAFTGEWYDEPVLAAHLAAGKRVCLVSPELHGRPHLAFWERLAAWPAVASAPELMLCTDFPDLAHRFFHG